jgi:hypothetical protein
LNLGELWTGILAFLARIIIPVWNDIIEYLVLVITLVVLASIGGLALWWRRHSAANRSRVPKPIPAGHKPDDQHLPGPSLWPFVAPVGLLLVLFAVAFGPFESLANMTLLSLGVAIAAAGIIGWYLDANKEYIEVESGVHGSATATASPPGWSLKPPEGMHLPGPSAWPLLAPVGLLFVIAGLIFGPILFVGGAIMAIIAIVGWYFDAAGELDDLEAHGHPSQADRDPEKAWPRKLVPVYFIIGAGTILLTLTPWLLSLLPGSG